MEDGPPTFLPGSTCPAVLWIQLAVSTFRLQDSHLLRLDFPFHSARFFCTYAGPNPGELSPPVWPPPRSLATTCGISVDVFSSSYLDVSVQTVPLIYLFVSVYDTCVLHMCVPTFGYLRISAYLQLPEAFRSLSRPSSAPDAKAFPICSS